MSRDFPRYPGQQAWLVSPHTPFLQIQELHYRGARPCQRGDRRFSSKLVLLAASHVLFTLLPRGTSSTLLCDGDLYAREIPEIVRTYIHEDTGGRSCCTTMLTCDGTVSVQVTGNPAGPTPLWSQLSTQALTLYIAHVAGKLRHRTVSIVHKLVQWWGVSVSSLCTVYIQASCRMVAFWASLGRCFSVLKIRLRNVRHHWRQGTNQLLPILSYKEEIQSFCFSFLIIKWVPSSSLSPS